jgi:DNA polymerase-3 subunit chi
VTEVAFHFGAADRLQYACRLLRKATVAGNRVLVVCTAQDQQKLQDALWSVSATDFVSHCSADAGGAELRRAQVVLSPDAQQDPAAFAVLVNLGAEIPDGFERFGRVIEVVSQDALERQLARDRWKRYSALGYALIRHDLQQQAKG